MGHDMYAYAEVRGDDGWREADVEMLFDVRDYGIYGFLADVRNYSHSPVIAEPRGLPTDVSQAVAEDDGDDCDHFAHGWLSLAELLAYDYDQVFWDRRVTKQMPSGVWNGAALADEGEGEHVTLREFLGEYFFRELDRLKMLAPVESVRLVFWFS
jgi:hypothetical protein